MINQNQWNKLLKKKQDIQKMEEDIKAWQIEKTKLQLVIRSTAQKLSTSKNELMELIK